MKTMISETKGPIAKIAELGTIENRLVKTNSARFIVSLRDEPVLYEDLLDPERRKAIRGTTGLYCLKYDPYNNGVETKYKYVFYTGDLYGINIRVSGPEHFHKLAFIIPELGWLKRNTTYDDKLFAVAKAHPAMPIPFSLDAVRYYDMIVAKMNAAGIDPTENKPFVTFKFASNLPHLDVDIKSLYMPECKKYYFKALLEIEKAGAELAKTNQ